MRYLLFALALLLGSAMPPQARAQTRTSISIGVVQRGVSIGFTMSNYPALMRIPGYPVYYDPYADFNYFFYDGLYWAYVDDNWYASVWYNGPWDMISPYYVPLYVLRIPVRYYRRPPPYFRGWRADAPPRWGEHWGREWELRHRNWNRWDRRRVPVAAPLPSYQRYYSGNRYPHRLEQQRLIESNRYRYQPRDRVSRQLLEHRRNTMQPRSRERQPLRSRPSEQERRQRELRYQEEQRYRQQVRPSQPSRQMQPPRQPQQQPQQQRYAPQSRQRAQSPRSRSSDHRDGKRRSSQNRNKKQGDKGGG